MAYGEQRTKGHLSSRGKADQDPGRPRLNAEETLIRNLHALYLDAGGMGTGAYHHVRRNGLESEEGRFLEFVYILLAEIRLPIKRSTLGRTIRRILSRL